MTISVPSIVSLEYQTFFENVLSNLSNKINECSNAFYQNEELEGQEEALPLFRSALLHLEEEIHKIAQSAMYPGHTAHNFGNYSLAGRIHLLGVRIHNEIETAPNEFPSSLRTLDELVSLSRRAIRAHIALPLLEEEVERLPSIPSGLFCCLCSDPVMKTSDMDGNGSFRFELNSINKQPFGNYSLITQRLLSKEDLDRSFEESLALLSQAQS